MTGEMSERDADEKHSEWVADIYHKGKRLRFRGCGPGLETPFFSIDAEARMHPARANAHLHGRVVSYIDAPPPIFPEGSQ